MPAPTAVGDVLVSWIQTGYSPSTDYPFLWRIDPINHEASLLKEISPLYDPLYVPQPFIPLGGRLYFTGYSQRQSAAEPVVTYLWSSDGTPGGTVPVLLSGGGAYEYPAALTLYNDKLYFFASDENPSNYKLWKSVGTPQETVALEGVRGIAPTFLGYEGNTAVGLGQPPMAVIGGNLLFAGASIRNSYKPYALYRTDPSDSIVFLKDFAETPGLIVEMRGIGYFAAVNYLAVRGQQLWRTDGTPDGTRMVSAVGPYDLDPSSMIAAGDSLYFSTLDGSFAPQVWKSDGTDTGTVLLKQVRSDQGPAPRGFVAALGQVFFLADDGVHGEELWATDGTAAGTRLVKDIRPGSDDPHISDLVAFGPWVLFSADDGIHGQELWRTDGTEAGTVLVADIAPGPPSSAPQTLVPYGNAVYFSADDSFHGRELWQTDGTAVGTQLVADFLPGPQGSNPFLIANPESSLFFLAIDPQGLALWKMTGSAAGLERIATVDSGTKGLSSNPYDLMDVGGQVCFFTNSWRYTEASRLWASDGTGEGTRAFATIQPETMPTSVGSSLYFSGWTSGGSVNDKFYRFDLSTGVLQPLADTYANHLAAVGQTLYFSLNYSELWKTDAGSGDDALVKRFDGAPASLVASAGVLYVSIYGNAPGLWKSDGTDAGTLLVWSGFAGHLTSAMGSLYFTSYDSSSRRAFLWVVPFGASSATVIWSFPLDPVYGDPFSDLVGTESGLYFLVRDVSPRTYQLWKSDGTEATTHRLSDVAVQTGSVRSDGSRAYFVVTDQEHGRELWTSDGTPQGTILVKDINPGFFDSNPSALAVIDGVLLFSADDGLHGRELWRSDGTPEGTYLFQDICPGACSSNPGGFAKSGSLIFFAANDHETGNELWAMPASAIQALPGARSPIAVPRRR